MVNAIWWQRIEKQAAKDDITRPKTKNWSSFPIPSMESLKIESPIEHRLYSWLKPLSKKYGYTVKCQWELNNFRYDFALVGKNEDHPLLLIECDGAAFHSTQEQLNRDAEKDKVARAAGYALMRFTGREIWRDAHRCAEAAFFRIWPRR